MLGPERAQAELAQVKLGPVLIDTIPIRKYGDVGPIIDELSVYSGAIPEGSPLADPSIDVRVLARGKHITDAQHEEPHIVGRVAVEHTPGDEPAVVDMRSQGLNEKVVGRAVPRILRLTDVKRAVLPTDRTNVPDTTIRDTGYERDDSGSFLILAA